MKVFLGGARGSFPTSGADKLRYGGDVLEHHTFFLIDPDHNWLEFKHYVHPEAIFGCHDRQTVGDLELRPLTSPVEFHG